MLIPSLVLKQLYNRGSLKNAAKGVQFSMKNRLSDGKLTGLESVSIGGKNVPIEDVLVDCGNGDIRPATELSESNPADFPLKKVLNIFREQF